MDLVCFVLRVCLFGSFWFGFWPGCVGLGFVPGLPFSLFWFGLYCALLWPEIPSDSLHPT